MAPYYKSFTEYQPHELKWSQPKYTIKFSQGKKKRHQNIRLCDCRIQALQEKKFKIFLMKFLRVIYKDLKI